MSMPGGRGDDPWTQAPEQGPRDYPLGEGRLTEDWSQRAIQDLLGASLREQRRARRWGILFKSLLFVYLFALLFVFAFDWQESASLPGGRQTALIDVSGIIAADREANADALSGALRKAFEDTRTAAVILRINSPGGSPVQAEQIYREVKRLRNLHPNTPLYAVITDVGASGGYYVAAAADRIFADRASIVGSIGVRMDGFGFVEAMKKLGIERRLLTAGNNKGMLDPFQPVDPTEQRHMKELLETVHQQFVDRVREGRGDRIGDDPRLFSGLVWTGVQAVELGLVDELRSAGEVAREVVGVEQIRDYTPREDLLRQLVERFGVVTARALGSLSGGPVLR